MIERWKPIIGYEGLYSVSNLGRVKSVQSDRILKQATNQPYNTVSLNKNGIRKTYAVHKLVSKMFLPNPLGLPIINHKNENKRDNKVDNLEWCTAKYNTTYGTLPQRKSERTKGENNPQSKLTTEDVRRIRDLRSNGMSCSKISEIFGVCSDHIYQIVTKRRWKHIE